MKTTVELPDALLRRAKAAAALEGTTLKQLIAEGLVRRLGETGQTAEPAWRSLVGQLADLKSENRRVARLIEAEFEVLDEEDGF